MRRDGGRREKHRRRSGDRRPVSGPGGAGPYRGARRDRRHGRREAPAEQIGYRGPTACAATGITYRQLDYWARTGLVEPSVRPAYGSGTQRLYSFPTSSC